MWGEKSSTLRSRFTRNLARGILENAYKQCLTYELRQRGLRVETEVYLPIIYNSVQIAKGYPVDQILEDGVITELKAVSRVLEVHDAQLLSHLN